METKNKTIIVDELEQMRHDMSELRSLLSEQRIVNERLMRRAMSKEMGKERRSVVMVAVLTIVAAPLYVLLMPQLGLPLWFVVVTIGFLVVACLASVWSVGRLLKENLITGDLLVVAQRIVEYKRVSNTWLKFSLPFLALWLVCFFCIVYNHSDLDMASGAIYGGIIGAFIGGALGVKYLIDSHRRLNDILQQIEDIKTTE